MPGSVLFDLSEIEGEMEKGLKRTILVTELFVHYLKQIPYTLKNWFAARHSLQHHKIFLNVNTCRSWSRIFQR